MRRLITLLLILPALAVGQSRFGHGGSGGVSVSSLLPIIADSSKWTSGTHVHAIKPRGGKSIQADTALVGYMNVGSSAGKFNKLSVVSATAGHGTGIGITTTAFNKRIDSYAQFADTSSIRFWIDVAGEPHISMISKPRATQDTVGFYSASGSWFIRSLNTINIGSGLYYFCFSGASLIGARDDTYKLGAIGTRYQSGYFSDSLYVAGKGQGATIIWGQARKIGDVADSAGVLDMNGGSPRIRMRAASGAEGLSYNSGSVATWDSLNVQNEKSVVADDGTITLATGVAGWGEVMAGDNEQWAHFRFSADGTVTLIANSALVSKTASAGDDSLMVYDAGSGIAIKNRLGATKKLALNIKYFAP